MSSAAPHACQSLKAIVLLTSPISVLFIPSPSQGYMYAHRLHNEGGNGFESLEPRRLKHPTETVSLPSLTLR